MTNGRKYTGTDDAKPRGWQTDEWLSDIFNHSQAGKNAVCSLCKQSYEIEEMYEGLFFPICNECDTYTTSTFEDLDRDDPVGYKRKRAPRPKHYMGYPN